MDSSIKDVNDVVRGMKKAEEVAQVARKVARRVEGPQGGSNVGGFLPTFRSFQVVGELPDGRIVIWSREKRKAYKHFPDRLRLEHLDQAGGREVAARVVRSSKDIQAPGQVAWRQLKREVVIAANRTQLKGERAVGDGVNYLGKRGLVVVSGNEAGVYDGMKMVAHTEPTIGGFLLEGAGAPWVSMGDLIPAVNEMTPERGARVLENLLALVGQWRFASSLSPQLVVGFILAQIIQSVWQWRPQMWLTGRAQSGKTLLLELVAHLLGDLALRIEGSSLSDAGLRQAIAGHYRVVLIDELERSASRQAILELLRSAGRAGMIVKGTPGQSVIKTIIRHMILVASIEVGLTRAAESSRFLIVELVQDLTRKPVFPSVNEVSRLRLEAVAFAIWAALKARDLVDRFPGIPGYDLRLLQGLAVCLSFFALTCGRDPVEALRDYVTVMADERGKTLEADLNASDEVALLRAILTSTVRVLLTDEETGDRAYGEASILQLLGSEDKVHVRNLETVGIKPLHGGRGVFICPELVARKLLKDTMWSGLNIASILKRLPGISKARLRLQGNLFRGFAIEDLNGILREEGENCSTKVEQKGGVEQKVEQQKP